MFDSRNFTVEEDISCSFDFKSACILMSITRGTRYLPTAELRYRDIACYTINCPDQGPLGFNPKFLCLVNC